MDAYRLDYYIVYVILLISFCWYITSQCLDIRWNTPSRVWYITSRWLDIRWITPSCVWYITSSVWKSNDLLLLVFDMSSASQCLHIRWNTPSRVWYITYRCLEIKWNTLPRVSYITSLCLIIRWIVFDISHHGIWISNETILVAFGV